MIKLSCCYNALYYCLLCNCFHIFLVLHSGFCFFFMCYVVDSSREIELKHLPYPIEILQHFVHSHLWLAIKQQMIE